MPLVPLEALVLCIDAVIIKLLASLGSFQQDEFRGVTWACAGILAAVGNSLSFLVGVVTSGSPWKS